MKIHQFTAANEALLAADSCMGLFPLCFFAIEW